MKSFVTSGTGSEQTLSEIESEKIPVYESETDLDADLANLADNELALYVSEGSELSAPVDTVQSGNMHVVTSNAVAVALAKLKLKYFTINGTSDVYGNMRMLNPSNTIPVLFTSDIAGTDANYNIFYSSIVQDYYMHISNFVTGACIANASIIGRVYYLEFSE